ncbi:hypothetical protein [Hymenobacter elongatus]|uniref:Uncharacterized protein n=1 Tax=Hymenobacter elongatus TaxID=877208 RepID=A0A4Z0PRA6_9BACT|nr:hypothetical protein [Hymenobacter elongatus]TGE20045.1 hypothetical protein E5J99_00310 [Hymenobacter elongatus]
MTTSYCSNDKITDGEYAGTGTEPSPPTSNPEPSEIIKLERKLERVKALIMMKEREYRSFVGDASMATMLATNPESSSEDIELAQERAQLSLKAAEECKAEMNKLEKEKEEVEENTLTLK